MQGEKEFKLESMRRPFRNSYTECSHTQTFLSGAVQVHIAERVSSVGLGVTLGPNVLHYKNRADSPLHGTIVPTIHSPLTCTAESQAIRDGAQIK